MSWVAAFILLCLVTPLVEGESCGLACFLANATVHVGTVETENGDAALTDLTCSNFGVSDLSSESLYLSSAIRVNCSADWRISLLKKTLGSGPVKFSIEIDLALQLAFSGSPFPSKLTASNIQSTLVFNIFEIHAKSKSENYLLQKAKDFIAKEITKKFKKDAPTQIAELLGQISANLASQSVFLSSPVPSVLTPLYSDDPHYDNLNGNTAFIRFLDFFLNSALGVNGPLNPNFLINHFSHGKNEFDLSGSVANGTLNLVRNVAGIGSFDFTILGGIIAGLKDTFTVFDLLVPVSNNVFESHLGLKSLRFENISFVLSAQIDNITDALTENVSLTLDLADIATNTTTILLVDRDFELQGDQYFDPGCIERTILNASVASSESSTRVNRFTFASNRVTLDGQVAELFDNVFENLNVEFPSFFPTLVARTVRQPIIDKLNLIVDQFIGRENSSSCGLYSERSEGLYNAFPLPELSTIVSFSVAGFLSFIVIVLVVYNRDVSGSSLFFTSSVPMWLRLTIPIALFFSMASFAVLIAGTTGFTSLIITSNTTEIIPQSLFLFNLPSLVRDCYESGAWANVLGLAVLGIFWIHARQVAVLVAFFVPVSNAKHQRWRRKSILLLDYLGKWAGFFMIEALLIPMAFRLHVEPVEGFIVDLYTAGSGPYFLYIFFFLVTLVVGSLAALAERYASESVTPVLAFQDTRESLARRSFVWNRRQMKLKLSVVVLTVFGLVMVLTLTLLGIFVESFSFTLGGMAGLLLPMVNTTKTRSYSVFSTMTDYDSLTLPGTLVTFSQAAVIATCTIMPIVCSLAFFALFLVPMTKRGLSRFVVFVEVCRTWNLLEVHAGAILAAILSIGLIGEYILGDKCDLINRILVAYFSDLMDGDPKCFDVITAPMMGFWFMLIASLLSLGVGQFLADFGRRILAAAAANEMTSEEFLLDSPRQQKEEPSRWIQWVADEIEDENDFFRSQLN